MERQKEKQTKIIFKTLNKCRVIQRDMCILSVKQNVHIQKYSCGISLLSMDTTLKIVRKKDSFTQKKQKLNWFHILSVALDAPEYVERPSTIHYVVCP